MRETRNRSQPCPPAASTSPNNKAEVKQDAGSGQHEPPASSSASMTRSQRAASAASASIVADTASPTKSRSSSRGPIRHDASFAAKNQHAAETSSPKGQKSTTRSQSSTVDNAASSTRSRSSSIGPAVSSAAKNQHSTENYSPKGQKFSTRSQSSTVDDTASPTRSISSSKGPVISSASKSQQSTETMSATGQKSTTRSQSSAANNAAASTRSRSSSRGPVVSSRGQSLDRPEGQASSPATRGRKAVLTSGAQMDKSDSAKKDDLTAPKILFEADSPTCPKSKDHAGKRCNLAAVTTPKANDENVSAAPSAATTRSKRASSSTSLQSSTSTSSEKVDLVNERKSTKTNTGEDSLIKKELQKLSPEEKEILGQNERIETEVENNEVRSHLTRRGRSVHREARRDESLPPDKNTKLKSNEDTETETQDTSVAEKHSPTQRSSSEEQSVKSIVENSVKLVFHDDANISKMKDIISKAGLCDAIKNTNIYVLSKQSVKSRSPFSSPVKQGAVQRRPLDSVEHHSPAAVRLKFEDEPIGTSNQRKSSRLSKESPISGVRSLKKEFSSPRSSSRVSSVKSEAPVDLVKTEVISRVATMPEVSGDDSSMEVIQDAPDLVLDNVSSVYEGSLESNDVFEPASSTCDEDSMESDETVESQEFEQPLASSILEVEGGIESRRLRSSKGLLQNLMTPNISDISVRKESDLCGFRIAQEDQESQKVINISSDNEAVISISFEELSKMQNSLQEANDKLDKQNKAFDAERKDYKCKLSALEDKLKDTIEELVFTRSESTDVNFTENKTKSQLENQLKEAERKLSTLEKYRDEVSTVLDKQEQKNQDTTQLLVEARHQISALQESIDKESKQKQLTIEKLEARVLELDNNLNIEKQNKENLLINVQDLEQRYLQSQSRNAGQVTALQNMLDKLEEERKISSDQSLHIQSLNIQLEALKAEKKNMEGDKVENNKAETEVQSDNQGNQQNILEEQEQLKSKYEQAQADLLEKEAALKKLSAFEKEETAATTDDANVAVDPERNTAEETVQHVEIETERLKKEKNDLEVKLLNANEMTRKVRIVAKQMKAKKLLAEEDLKKKEENLSNLQKLYDEKQAELESARKENANPHPENNLTGENVKLQQVMTENEQLKKEKNELTAELGKKKEITRKLRLFGKQMKEKLSQKEDNLWSLQKQTELENAKKEADALKSFKESLNPVQDNNLMRENKELRGKIQTLNQKLSKGEQFALNLVNNNKSLKKALLEKGNEAFVTIADENYHLNGEMEKLNAEKEEMRAGFLSSLAKSTEELKDKNEQIEQLKEDKAKLEKQIEILEFRVRKLKILGRKVRQQKLDLEKRSEVKEDGSQNKPGDEASMNSGTTSDTGDVEVEEMYKENKRLEEEIQKKAEQLKKAKSLIMSMRQKIKSFRDSGTPENSTPALDKDITGTQPVSQESSDNLHELRQELSEKQKQIEDLLFQQKIAEDDEAQYSNTVLELRRKVDNEKKLVTKLSEDISRLKSDKQVLENNVEALQTSVRTLSVENSSLMDIKKESNQGQGQDHSSVEVSKLREQLARVTAERDQSLRARQILLQDDDVNKDVRCDVTECCDVRSTDTEVQIIPATNSSQNREDDDGGDETAAKLEDMERQLNRYKSLHNFARQSNQVFAQTLVSKDKEVQEEKKKYRDLVETCKLVQDSVATLEMVLKDREERHPAVEMALEKMTRVVSHLDNHQNRISHLEKQMDNINDRLTNINSLIEKFETKVVELCAVKSPGQTDGYSGRLNFTEKCELIQKKVENATRYFFQYKDLAKKKKVAQDANIAKLEEIIKKTRNDKDILSKVYKKCLAYNESLKKEMDSINSDPARRPQPASDLEDPEDLAGQLDKHKSSIELKNKIIADLDSKIRNLLAKRNNKENETSDLIDKEAFTTVYLVDANKELESRNEILTALNNDLTQRKEKLMSENKLSNDLCNQLGEKIEALSTNLDKTTSEKERLEKVIDELRRKRPVEHGRGEVRTSKRRRTDESSEGGNTTDRYDSDADEQNRINQDFNIAGTDRLADLVREKENMIQQLTKKNSELSELVHRHGLEEVILDVDSTQSDTHQVEDNSNLRIKLKLTKSEMSRLKGKCYRCGNLSRQKAHLGKDCELYKEHATTSQLCQTCGQGVHDAADCKISQVLHQKDSEQQTVPGQDTELEMTRRDREKLKKLLNLKEQTINEYKNLLENKEVGSQVSKLQHRIDQLVESARNNSEEMKKLQEDIETERTRADELKEQVNLSKSKIQQLENELKAERTKHVDTSASHQDNQIILQAEKKNLEKRIKELEAQLQQEEESGTAKSNRALELNLEIIKYKEKINEQTKEIADLQKNLKDTKTAGEREKARLDEKEKLLRNERVACVTLTKRLEEIGKKLEFEKNSSSKLKDVEKELIMDMDICQQKNNELSDNLQEERNKCSLLETELSSLKAVKDDLKNRNDNLASELMKISELLKEENKKVENIKTEVSLLKGNNSLFKSQLEKAKAEVKYLTEKVKKDDLELDSNRCSILELRRLNNKLEDKIKMLNSEIGKLKNEMNQEKEDRERHKSRGTEELQRCRQRLQSAETQKEKLKQDLEEETKLRKTERERLSETISGLNAQVEQLNERCSKQVAEMDSLSVKLQQDSADRDTASADLRVTLREVQDECKQLKQQVQDLENKLADSISEGARTAALLTKEREDCEDKDSRLSELEIELNTEKGNSLDKHKQIQALKLKLEKQKEEAESKDTTIENLKSDLENEKKKKKTTTTNVDMLPEPSAGQTTVKVKQEKSVSPTRQIASSPQDSKHVACKIKTEKLATSPGRAAKTGSPTASAGSTKRENVEMGGDEAASATKKPKIEPMDQQTYDNLLRFMEESIEEKIKARGCKDCNPKDIECDDCKKFLRDYYHKFLRKQVKKLSDKSGLDEKLLSEMFRTANVNACKFKP